MLPTPTGVGFTAGFDGAGIGQPVPEQAKLNPVVLGPILLMNASLVPEGPACNGVTAGMLGSVATGKFPDAVSPAT